MRSFKSFLSLCLSVVKIAAYSVFEYCLSKFDVTFMKAVEQVIAVARSLQNTTYSFVTKVATAIQSDVRSFVVLIKSLNSRSSYTI